MRNPARQQIAQTLGGVLRPRFLGVGEHPVEDDDDEDGNADLGHAGNESEDARRPQQQREEVGQLRGKRPQP